MDAKKHLMNFLGISQMATWPRLVWEILSWNYLAGQERLRENERLTYPYISFRNINGKWKFHSLFLTNPRVNPMVSKQLIFQIHKVLEKNANCN